jgi:DNA-binding transcriptional LysR family regulator
MRNTTLNNALCAWHFPPYRHKRGVHLTAKGRVFYDYTVRVLKLSEEAVTIMRDFDHARGKLALGSLEATAKS